MSLASKRDEVITTMKSMGFDEINVRRIVNNLPQMVFMTQSISTLIGYVTQTLVGDDSSSNHSNDNEDEDEDDNDENMNSNSDNDDNDDNDNDNDDNMLNSWFDIPTKRPKTCNYVGSLKCYNEDKDCPFPEPMTLMEIRKLKPKDKIDFRGKYYVLYTTNMMCYYDLYVMHR